MIDEIVGDEFAYAVQLGLVHGLEDGEGFVLQGIHGILIRLSDVLMIRIWLYLIHGESREVAKLFEPGA